jgi:hypothetical protein
MILLISASQVARIAGVSHRCPASFNPHKTMECNITPFADEDAEA